MNPSIIPIYAILLAENDGHTSVKGLVEWELVFNHRFNSIVWC